MTDRPPITVATFLEEHHVAERIEASRADTLHKVRHLLDAPPQAAYDVTPVVRRVAMAQARAEDTRLLRLVRSAFLPFTPEVRVWRLDDGTDTIIVGIGTVPNELNSGTRYRVPVDVANLHRYGPAEVAQLVAREVRRMWHAETPPEDTPNVVRGSD